MLPNYRTCCKGIIARDVILVPSYWRPEFLYLCLEALYSADGNYDKEIRVYEDVKQGDRERFEHEMAETQEVLAYWKRGLGNRLRTILRPANNYYGNSYNILEAYKKAYSEDWRYVYLIEDDVLVATDFFTWHENLQSRADCFCTIAGATVRNPKLDVAKEENVSSEIYASLGVCWKRENLSWVLDHSVSEYYNNPTLHVLKKFRGSKYGTAMIEQDGVIQRVAEQQFQKFVYPTKPKAFHVGVYGYHRGIGFKNMFYGTLAERIEKYRTAISNPDWLEKVAGFQTDLQAFPKPSNTVPAFSSHSETN